MLACVVNVSEGRDRSVLAALAAAAGDALLDVHSDAHHHRSVFTLGGPPVEAAVRRLVTGAVRLIDLRGHRGAHPRLGSADVVPFVPLAATPFFRALAARDAFAAWAATALGLPCFLYGPDRSLPEVRRLAFGALAPDRGPTTPHPTAGAVAVGARPVLVAYNLWLAPGVGVDRARAVARSIRSTQVRALGLDLGGQAQVSCNLVSPTEVGPAAAYDAVAAQVAVDRAELVGLLPAAVLDAIPPARWPRLDLAADRTIEARLKQAGFDL
ncbi:MAG: glutamate formiminotransferase [Acidimicrobiales bacterium]